MKTFGSRKKKAASVPVYLNVYHLTSINGYGYGYAYWLGLDVYHSGVQVHGGVEYAITGIFQGEPKQCPGFTFLKNRSKPKGGSKLAHQYTGNTYNLITKNYLQKVKLKQNNCKSRREENVVEEEIDKVDQLCLHLLRFLHPNHRLHVILYSNFVFFAFFSCIFTLTYTIRG